MEKNGGNSTIRDMTSGSPVKLIIQFMIPMFLGNIFQQFYNIADSIVAGQFLGVRALAAIGSTGSLMFFVTGWLNGLSSGFAILVAQWFGAKKYDRMRHYVAMSIYLMVAFAVAMTIGFEIANRPIMHLMNYSEEIMPDVTSYMGIIYAGLIVTAAYNALAAFLRALGDSSDFMPDLYREKIPDSSSEKRKLYSFFSGAGKTSGTRYSDGIAVFYHRDRCHCGAGCDQCIRGKLHGRVFGSRKTAEYFQYRVCRFWCDHRYLCWTEPRSGENGQSQTGCALYAADDLCIQHLCHAGPVFSRKTYGTFIY